MSEHTDQEIVVPGLGVFKFDKRLSEDHMSHLRDRLNEMSRQQVRTIVAEQGIEFHPLPNSLQLNDEQKAALKQFHDDGLVWLVNTAILHPRGWALTIHVDEDGTPFGLSIQGDGTEPWIFAPGANADVLLRYEQAEQRREGTVTGALESVGQG